MRKSILLIFVTLLAAAGSARSIDIIPRPAEITEARGEFRITAQTAIAAEGELRRPAEIFATDIEPVIGREIPVAAKGEIRLRTSPSLGAEEYTLAVTPRTVEILGGSPQAVFYALQTLPNSSLPTEQYPRSSSATNPASHTAAECSTPGVLSGP